MGMKAISIRQPWAGLIFHGKDVENRVWATGYRGPLLIHAAKTPDKEAFHYFETPDGRDLMGRNSLPADSQLFGGIIGLVNLTGCYLYRRLPSHRRSVWHAEDQYGFYLSDPVLFHSMIRCRGQLSIYEPAEGDLYEAERLIVAAYA